MTKNKPAKPKLKALSRKTRAHAFLSPSAAGRWLTECIASPYWEEGSPYADKSSPAAREGTAAHEMFEYLMNTGEMPALQTKAQNGEVFTGEMCQYVSAGHRGLMHRFPDMTQWLSEIHIPIWKAFDFKYPWIWGTADVVAHAGNTLLIADLKYGMFDVSPVGNKQLLFYALGAAHKFEWRHDVIELCIIQPRTKKIDQIIKVHTISKDDLIAFRNTTKEQITKVLQRGFKTPPNVSSACHFCKAKLGCPAIKQNAADREFSEYLLDEELSI